MHLTIGSHEMLTFQNSQNQLKNARMPFFVLVDGDLSGSLK
jgi:hypothetical protein